MLELEVERRNLRDWGRLFQRAGAEDLKERAPKPIKLRYYIYSKSRTRSRSVEDKKVQHVLYYYNINILSNIQHVASSSSYH